MTSVCIKHYEKPQIDSVLKFNLNLLKAVSCSKIFLGTEKRFWHEIRESHCISELYVYR